MEKAQFIPTIAPLVQEENKKRGNPLFSSVVIAQAICESGWGQATIMMKANAIFGIKATSNWKGRVYNANTKECYDGVNYTNINACFRAYNSLEESIKDYFDLILGLSRYKNAINCSSPLACITAIKKGSYATSPTYINTIMSIINANNLTKYDNVENVNNYVDKLPTYEIGKNYKVQVDLNVRAGAGTNYRIKNYNELTIDGKNHAYKQTNAILKPNTTVTCLDVYIGDNEIWLQIPSRFCLFILSW
ncbi:MAG: glucosaminidase domain-containing protein [Candidatus Onthovivens sp.]|nr:glucosaminidase domain-containing protein [Bacilli bacterium]